MQKILITVIFSILIFGSACSIYQAPVQQGNLITQEMVNQLKIGMSKSEVIRIMGNPLVVDEFNSDRWTYFYRLTENGELVHEYKVILSFKNNRLVQIDGKALPEAEVLKPR